MEYKDLTADTKEKLLACKTAEDILDLAKEVGYELSDEELDAVAGGAAHGGGGAGNGEWSCGAL